MRKTITARSDRRQKFYFLSALPKIKQPKFINVLIVDYKQNYKQMFVFLLTTITLYDIIQEYRRMCCLYSFAVQLRLYGYFSSTRGVSADMTAPQSAMLCKDFSAKRAAPEPFERRAIMGFCKRAIFCLSPFKWLSFFERRQAYFVLQFFTK